MLECIIDSNRPISAEVSAYLHRKASEMMRSKEKQLRVKGKVCRGIITTDGAYGNLGSISGLLFKAEIEHDSVDITITFIVRHANLHSDARGWVSGPTEIAEQLVALEERAQLHSRHLN